MAAMASEGCCHKYRTTLALLLLEKARKTPHGRSLPVLILLCVPSSLTFPRAILGCCSTYEHKSQPSQSFAIPQRKDKKKIALATALLASLLVCMLLCLRGKALLDSTGARLII